MEAGSRKMSSISETAQDRQVSDVKVTLNESRNKSMIPSVRQYLSVGLALKF